MMILVFLPLYYLLVLTKIPNLYKLVFCVMHGISIAAIGFNIAHDAGHYSDFLTEEI